MNLFNPIAAPRPLRDYQLLAIDMLREAIAADHAVLSLFASRAGIPAPFPLHP